ncbi:lysophospholipid acyltransferase family protein [Variovorax sp. PCZ-1]|uniref:lysophospholipid acyltransferase family protein n=1 Tax=Variovorax sp. PCZ-1 TaxID=2835533 RepID=UPI001BCC23D4|nr:lysophospholipid acyltransferase family protein [Variovorax sp. PCZ-1]MBS7807243.1 1-acyl-sn-glycerol-3-phosphate acyltransferase [Variovorax sp. PCZ-1]
MRSLLALLKLTRCILHLLHGMWTILTKFSSATHEQRAQHVADWSKHFLQLLDVTVRVQGQPLQKGPLMVVINHVSWLDILVLLAAQPVCFVSKSEVRHWPVIGWLATNVGTLYIERSSRKDALRVVHQIADNLKAGHLIAVFPEGTTSDGKSVLPFHANLLQAAISVASPIQPVALRYLEQNETLSMSPVYIDDDTLLSSVWRMLRADPVTASLDFLPSLPTDGLERRALAAQLEAQIAHTLQLPS